MILKVIGSGHNITIEADEFTTQPCERGIDLRLYRNSGMVAHYLLTDERPEDELVYGRAYLIGPDGKTIDTIKPIKVSA